MGLHFTQYFAWLELLPGASVEIGSTPVEPADQMEAAITESSPGQWTIGIEDVTQSGIYSGPFTYSTPGTSAEWIEEAPTVGGVQSTLANFGHTTFTNMAVGGSSANSTLDPVYMLNPAGTVFIAYPGTYNSSAGSFTDYYGTPPPVVTP